MDSFNKKILLIYILIVFFIFAPISLANDVIAPVVKITSPKQRFLVFGPQVVVEVRASDNQGIRKIKLDVNGIQQTTVYTKPYLWTWNIKGLKAGEYYLRARAYDKSYNRSDHEIQIFIDNKTEIISSPPPPWAKQAYDALQNYKYIVDFWVKHVAKNTSQNFFDVVGGWNDDVELSQSLMAYWLLTGDDALAKMFQDMGDKIQEAPYIGKKSAPWSQPQDKRIEQGYGTVMLDVDHSAEETTLIFPRLFLIDYGEPTSIELMTRLVWNFQDNMDTINFGEENWGQWVKTGILMRSPRFNARTLDWCWHVNSEHICFEPQDTINNFRTTAPALSLAWYYGANHYFWGKQVNGFIRAHHEAWIDATLQKKATKPALIPPSKILVPSLDFGDWTRNDADPTGAVHGWISGAWIFRHFYNAMIADTLLFNNHPDIQTRKIASHASRILNYAYSERQQGKRVPIVNEPFSLDRQFLQWRAESGPMAKDDLFLSNRAAKSPNTRVMAYLINLERHNLATALLHVTDAFHQLSRYLSTKRANWTTNLIKRKTGLTDQVKFGLSDSFLMAALGGSGIYDGAYPTIYYSFEDTDAQVVSLVKDRDTIHTSFWLYNFGKEREIGLKLWRIAKGSGQLTFGPDVNQDGKIDKITQVLPIEKIRKGIEIRFRIPSNIQYLAQIEVTKSLTPITTSLPDLAIGRKDFFSDDKAVSCRIHNIGTEAQNVTIRLYNIYGLQMAEDISVNFASFNTMNPVTNLVTWKNVDSNEIGWIVIDPDNKILELTKINNVLTVKGGGSTKVQFPLIERNGTLSRRPVASFCKYNLFPNVANIRVE